MKLSIKNRKGLKLVIQVDNPKGIAGLVYIAHGLSGNKEESHIQVFAESLLNP